MVKELSVSALALFTDLNDIPKLAVAERRSGPLKGHITFPGGKNEGSTQLMTLVDEVRQETGVVVPSDAKIRRIRNPIRFILGDQPIALSLFFAEIGRSFPDTYWLQWREPDKLLWWQWQPFSWLREKVDANLFPQPVYDKVVYASKRLGVQWVGDIPAAVWDFPFYGLHSIRSLRRKAGLYKPRAR